MLHRLCLLLCLCLLGANSPAQALPAGYDVVLLVGQSNMAGTGTGPDTPKDASVDPRVFQWDAASQTVIPAVDSLVQNPTQPGNVGLGLTFGKAYAASLPANRKVLLVGSAAGGTSFISGRWKAPGGDLATTAVARANGAMAAAGPGARFAGILWHQGESDITEGGAAAYQANLLGLIKFFRSSVTGAGSTTPFIAGELVYPWMASITADPKLLPALDTFLNVIHTLPDTVPHTGWVSTAGLGSDANTGLVHFSALSQRELGRRYAQRFLSVANNLLVNGGFDDNNVPAGNWAFVASLAGWQGSGGVVEVWRNVAGWQGVNGNSWVELDAGDAVDTYSQTITSTPGDLLTLRFWYSARPGTGAATNRFDVLWNGVVIDTLSPDGAGLTAPSWQSKAYAVTSSGRDTVAFRESGVNDVVGTLLDAVTLTSTGTGTHATISNLALGKAATQSSDLVGAVAARAVDGNTSGSFPDGSVTHTGGAAQDWWQVDLGSTAWVHSVRLFNRTDCCADRLSNVDVLVSSTDMNGRTLAQLRADAGVVRQSVPMVGNRIELPFGVNGRYVRVQLAGANYLSLAEVQVMGWPSLSVDLSAAFNAYALSSDGAPVLNGGFDGSGYAYSANVLGTSLDWNARRFTLGPANARNAVANATIALPAGRYSRLSLLGAASFGRRTGTVVVNYTDGTASTFTQVFSDWGQAVMPVLQANELVASAMPYRNFGTSRSAYAGYTFDLYGYGFALNPAKTVKSLTLPTDSFIKILAADLY